MKIETIDFFYLAMPEVRDIGDGSQDALLVRIRANGLVGWGECEAAPLVSIASWNCPMSHAACKPLSASVLGKEIHTPDDIRRINALVHANSFDLLQADHTLSGVDVALWDLLGKKLGAPASGSRPSTVVGRSGWRSRSSPARWRPTGSSPAKHAAYDWPAARAATTSTR